jgi:DNA-binding response OmpR family regulator
MTEDESFAPECSGRILIVDDERSIREGLKALLSAEGFTVTMARNGQQALDSFDELRHDLVLLDVMMPGMNGFQVCQAIREIDRTVPVVFLTAKDSDADQVRGFGLGADDYISKDAPESLLVVRLRRLLERFHEISTLCTGRANAVLIGDVVIDLQTLTVKQHRRLIARLTKTEADILEVLNLHRAVVVKAEEIIAFLRGEGFVCEDTMLYVHISNLRRKLGDAGKDIVSVRGVGYMLN